MSTSARAAHRRTHGAIHRLEIGRRRPDWIEGKPYGWPPIVRTVITVRTPDCLTPERVVAQSNKRKPCRPSRSGAAGDRQGP
jgi:hypothetical protein